MVAKEQVVDFERVLIAKTAAATANTPDTVRAIVSESIEQRPLRYLAACRYPNVPQLFIGLRRNVHPSESYLIIQLKRS